jgi:hypothetical protein
MYHNHVMACGPHLGIESREAGSTHGPIHVRSVKFCGFCLPGWVPRTENGKVMENIRTTPGNRKTCVTGYVTTYKTSSWCRVWGGQIDTLSEHVGMVKFGGFCLPRWVPHTEKRKVMKNVGTTLGNRKTRAMWHVTTYGPSSWSRVWEAGLTHRQIHTRTVKCGRFCLAG